MNNQNNSRQDRPSPMTKGDAPDTPVQEKLRGEDVKEARGLNKDVGHSPNEAGTDQKVEDAKRARHDRKH